MSNNNLVFVYGTLKQGYGNHRLLSTAEFVGLAKTVDPFVMVNVGFPYLIRTHDDRPNLQVYGELYRVDDPTLDRLDGLEGVAYDHYVREKIQVVCQGKTYDTFVYLASASTASGVANLQPQPNHFVEEGDLFYEWKR